MNESELVRVASELSMQLPDYYRTTMLSYPFPGRGDIEQAELVNDPDLLISLNRNHPAAEGSKTIFVIGTDRSEESYYVKTGEHGSTVYCFELETGKHLVLDASWDEYLARCERQIQEAEADERLMTDRAANRKWWQLW